LRREPAALPDASPASPKSESEWTVPGSEANSASSGERYSFDCIESTSAPEVLERAIADTVPSDR